MQRRRPVPGLSSHARAKAPTGARPGQGRPRGAIGRKANWRERNRCSGADRRPPLFCCRNSASAKVVQLLLELDFCCRNSASAKVVQLLLELDFCCRNSASAKVVQLLLELLVPRGAAGRQPGWRERKKTSNFCWNWIFVVAIPRWSAKVVQLLLELLVPRGAAGQQPGWRERKNARKKSPCIRSNRLQTLPVAQTCHAILLTR